MVLSHRNHGNFSKKLTCFLNPNQKEKTKCQDFSEKKIHAPVVSGIGLTTVTKVVEKRFITTLGATMHFSFCFDRKRSTFFINLHP